MALMSSHFACSSPMRRSFPMTSRLARCPNFSSKLEFLVSNQVSAVKLSAPYARPNISCSAQSSTSYTEDFAKPLPRVEDNGSVYSTTAEVENHVTTEQKKYSKIHDFCFGIPFGSTILIGGILGFIFSKNVSTLYNGILSGGGLLALSTISLNIWRQGKSCFPFILGQAVIALAFMWTNYRNYLLTKNIFPAAFYAAISAAMLCFYSYVVISGGNRPPKKVKSSAIASNTGDVLQPIK